MKRLIVKHNILGLLFMLSHLHTWSQEYTYDVNGNLKTDGNKQIASVHYNYMNLADTILYSDGRKMIYTYTATGQKLSEKSILANGTVKQKRDYAGSILYQNDSLREIKHEDGRVVPVNPGNNTTSWEYQYHLSDHLGNVRSTLTSKQGTETNTSTFESTNATAEQNKYLRYNVARKINAILFDHTHTATTHYSERLNGSANERYGIARSLSVMPGDIIKLEAYAKYIDPNQNNLTQALTTLLTQVAGGTAPAGTVVDGAGYATNGNTPFVFAGLNNTSGSSGAGPKAYLNWLVFDRNFIFKNGGYVRMTTAAKENGSNVPHEKLFKELVIKEPGYVYMYLSNEETTPLEVYFDDVSVTQVNSPVIQQSDYDPFGLAFHDYAREDAVPNNFLYNGKELQRDFDLNWYDYGARMYDAALGRWHVIDPKAEQYAAWSPYQYVLNNPARNIDPDGQEVRTISDPSTGGTIVSEVIRVHAEAPDNMHNDEYYDSYRNRIAHALFLLNRTAEGRRITSEVNWQMNLSVHIKGTPTFFNDDGNSTMATMGITGRASEVADVQVKNGRVILKAKYYLSSFDGMDISDDVNTGKQTILIVVRPGVDDYELAAIIGHEFDAHINIRNKKVYGGQKALRDPTSGDYDHQLFGSTSPPIFIPRYNALTNRREVKVITNATPGSPAERLATQLGALKAADARKK